MSNNKTVIIGGIAGGATTATRLRRLDEDREIIIFEKGGFISYANCGLPYYIGGVIEKKDSLVVQTPEKINKNFNVDVRIKSEVIKIDKEEKYVLVKNLTTNEEYKETYDELVIATGSIPLKPPIPGINGNNIYTLWTIHDTEKIKKIVDEKKPKTAAIIGGGFIGLEMAENLHHLGMKVSLIEMMNQVMAPLDYDMASLLHENIRMNNVDLILEDGVKTFEDSNNATKITLGSGKTVEADIVILSIGVRPNSILAKEAGLNINKRGGVIIDNKMKTSAEHIYAVGDVVEVDNFISKERTMIPLAGPANKQARILADNLVGIDSQYKGTMGTAIAKVFDLHAASVGMNEKQLIAKDMVKDKDYHTEIIVQKSHAGYYPGATMLMLKMIFTKEGKILGAQAIGQASVAKTIDTIATVMRCDGDIKSLQELELAYAPPFSSAKTPVNMLGFVADNILNGKIRFKEWADIDKMVCDKAKMENTILLDIREPEETLSYKIEAAINIPWSQLRDRMNELDKSKEIITFCEIGVRSYNASRILINNGFENVYTAAGGSTLHKSMHHLDFIDKEEICECQAAPEKTCAVSLTLDCTGMQCPGPIMKVSKTINSINDGDVISVRATDLGFARDVKSWCKATKNTYLATEKDGLDNIVTLMKGTNGNSSSVSPNKGGSNEGAVPTNVNDGKTLVVFSGDMDKAMASFIIANGAASMGKKVTMFFTFWGLNILRRPEGADVKKSFIESMFGKMMPKGVDKLKISKMNMGGMGTKMMKKVMHDKNVDTLQSLMQSALDNGVKMIACTMSMDVMGIRPEELIDGIELGGVATYLGDAEEANLNLFI